MNRLKTRQLQRIDKQIGDFANNATARIIGVAAGFATAGPLGAVVGLAVESVAEDVVKRFLSPKELTRIEKVLELAAIKHDEHIKKGLALRDDIDRDKYEEFFEGMLLKARESHEEKKIPLLANLFARVPFTNTPIENMMQTLIYAEQLSYRQLCILSVIQFAVFRSSLLSNSEYRDIRKQRPDEKTEGIFQDMFYMMRQGFIGQSRDEGRSLINITIPADIMPAYVVLLYPGMLLYNGLDLVSVEEVDRKSIIDVLTVA
jgi:hypothetical protein